MIKDIAKSGLSISVIVLYVSSIVIVAAMYSIMVFMYLFRIFVLVSWIGAVWFLSFSRGAINAIIEG